jgi:DNA-binding IclR family transcriptional regulator
VSRGEKLEGAVGIGAPVFAHGTDVLGSLSVTIPEQRFDEAAIDEIAAQVIRAAAELSRLQGGQYPQKVDI